jgi:hypothetical protein
MNLREPLIAALSDAAWLEHSLTCQYLFAAFSLKTHPAEGGVDWPQLERIRAWKAELLSMARQEMAHHGMVCNLLMAIGGAPRFLDTGFPHATIYCPPYPTLQLLPFSEEALERFVCYERLQRPTAGAPSRDGGIGALYTAIRQALERADRETARLFIGPLEHQVGNPELRIRQGQFDVDLAKAHDLRSALALVDRMREHDHHERMEAMRRELVELTRASPGFAPARPVAPNPRLRPLEGGSDPVSLIRHPRTRAAAELFSAAHETLVLMLSRLYGRSSETDAEAEVLTRLAFFPLMTAVIRPLGELLTHMPLEEGATTPTAGAPFGTTFGLPLQPSKRGAWVLLHERLVDHARACARLCADLPSVREPWAQAVQARFTMLQENLEHIARSFEQHLHLDRDALQHLLRRGF